MAVTVNVYGQAALNFAKGNFNWTSDTFKVLLCSSSYTFNKDTHAALSDITNELTATGYARQTATTKTATYVSGSDRAVEDFDDVTFSPGGVNTFTARSAVLFKDSGVAATSWLIHQVDFGADQTVTGAEQLVITWDSTDGAFYIQA